MTDGRGEGDGQETQEASESDRTGLREFVVRWTKAGPLLEDERHAKLQELDDESARRIMIDLFRLWRPTEIDATGEGLVEAQLVFGKLARMEAERRPDR